MKQPVFFYFSAPFPEKEQTIPISDRGEFSPGDGKCIQIVAGEHGVQSGLVFIQPTIRCFPITELTLDDSEYVLYFAAYRRFSVLNIPFPVNRVVTDLGETTGVAVDAVVYAG